MVCTTKCFLLAQFLAQEKDRKWRKRKRPIEPEVCLRTPPWTLLGVQVLPSSDGVSTGVKTAV